MSTNKVYGDNPNKLPLLKKNQVGMESNHIYRDGIMKGCQLTIAFTVFGASKVVDLVVQEYGKNIGLKTVCFRADAWMPKSLRSKTL